MDGIKPSRLISTTCQVNENLTSSTLDPRASTCLLKMTIEDVTASKEKTIVMELPPSTLKTLVDDFSRIRDQLSNVAKK